MVLLDAVILNEMVVVVVMYSMAVMAGRNERTAKGMAAGVALTRVGRGGRPGHEWSCGSSV